MFNEIRHASPTRTAACPAESPMLCFQREVNVVYIYWIISASQHLINDSVQNLLRARAKKIYTVKIVMGINFHVEISRNSMY